MNNSKMLFIIDTYGIKSQEDIAIEEMSELQKAILKHRRKESEKTREEIIDEIADVEIMIEQLKIIYSCRKEVKNRIDFKLDRQIKRILEEHGVVNK